MVQGMAEKMPEKNDMLMEGLLLKPDFQKLLDEFSASFGVRITFFTAGGRLLREPQDYPNSSFCRLIQSKTRGLEKCFSMDKEKQKEADKQKTPLCYQCHAGLMETIIPLYLEGELAGHFMMGQFRTTQELSVVAKKWIGSDYQLVELKKRFEAAVYIEESRAKHMTELLRILVDYVAKANLVGLKKNQLIEDLLAWIEKNPDKDLSLESAAALTGKSVSTISHLFRKVTGRSFKETILERRIARAEFFLRSFPDMPIRECAAKAGFEDALYFSRLYKKYRGVSPKVYASEQKKATELKII
jgi:AraC-like DNA-binding protein